MMLSINPPPHDTFQEIVVHKCASTCERRLPTVYTIFEERGLSYTAFLVYGGVLYAVIGWSLVHGGM